MAKLSARNIALDVLNQTEQRKIYVNIALNNDLRMTQLADERDKALVYKLVYGVLQHRMYLDHALNALSKRTMVQQPIVLRNIMRLAAYQLLFLDRVPTHAACNEAVIQTKQYQLTRASGYVNGVLRNLARNPQVVLPNEDTDLVHHLAVRYSHPPWMVSRWLKRWGKELTQQILKYNNEELEVSVRVNTLRTTLEKCQANLLDEGIVTQLGSLMPHLALRCQSISDLTELETYKKGHFTVQDEAAMSVVPHMQLQLGMRVLDMCSAPGVKTTQIAESMHNQGQILAVDIHEHRVKLVQENVERLGIDIVSTLVGDAKSLESQKEGSFDRILCDVPCSGLGTLRSNPEAKWYKEEADITELASLQLKILSRGLELLAPGGILVYSTCTNEIEETDDVIAMVEHRHKGAYKVISSRHVLPHEHDTVGFFIAVVQKKVHEGVT